MTETVAVPLNRFDRRRARSRAALLDAALELFQEHGVQHTTLEEICDRADVSVRTFFNHFETRERLHEAIAERRATQLAALIDAWTEQPRAFAVRVLELFSQTGQYLEERPAYREFVGEMLRLQPVGGSALVCTGCLGQAMRRFIENGIAHGEVEASQDPGLLADLMLGALSIGLTNWCANPDYPLAASLEASAAALTSWVEPQHGRKHP